MIKKIKDNDKIELKKSFYLLTRKLTEIETVFNVKIHAQFNQELTNHQDYIITACRSLDHLNVPKNIN